MTFSVDPRVDANIDALPDWQQVICREVRDLVHAADPEVAETIKFNDRPYFVLQGNICALLAAKEHVNVFLYAGAMVPDPEKIITGGHDNTTARTVAICQGETINAPALTTMFKQIIANNRTAGERSSARRDLSASLFDYEGGEDTGLTKEIVTLPAHLHSLEYRLTTWVAEDNCLLKRAGTTAEASEGRASTGHDCPTEGPALSSVWKAAI